MITRILIVTLVVAVVTLAWKLLNRRWSRQVYIQRDYEKFQRLDQQVTAEAVDIEPLIDRESVEGVINRQSGKHPLPSTRRPPGSSSDPAP